MHHDEPIPEQVYWRTIDPDTEVDVTVSLLVTPRRTGGYSTEILAVDVATDDDTTFDRVSKWAEREVLERCEQGNIDWLYV